MGLLWWFSGLMYYKAVLSAQHRQCLLASEVLMITYPVDGQRGGEMLQPWVVDGEFHLFSHWSLRPRCHERQGLTQQRREKEKPMEAFYGIMAYPLGCRWHKQSRFLYQDCIFEFAHRWLTSHQCLAGFSLWKPRPHHNSKFDNKIPVNWSWALLPLNLSQAFEAKRRVRSCDIQGLEKCVLSRLEDLEVVWAHILPMSSFG